MKLGSGAAALYRECCGQFLSSWVHERVILVLIFC
jgi:hypothetical protein